MLVYGNLVDLRAELPRLIERARGLIERLRTWGRDHLPAWVFDPAPDTARAEAETTARLKALASGLVNTAAGFLAEALVVGFYLIFLLLEARRLPVRVRAGFLRNRPTACSGSIASINRAMLVLPPGQSARQPGDGAARRGHLVGLRGVVSRACGASWPSSAISSPTSAAWSPSCSRSCWHSSNWSRSRDRSRSWRCWCWSQFVTNNFIEPRLTARAVDLSPLVVLVALAFWGLCWGVVGMVLAVPLTVMLKIVWENIALTRPLARLMAEE